MSYTTVNQVAAMFPTFTRNGPKGPADTLIQTFVDDVAAEIDAVLQRRFQETYANSGFAAWQRAFGPDQLNILEKMNRYGACAQLAAVFETAGIGAAAHVARSFDDRFREMCNKLNARDIAGRPLPQGGDYDYLFDVQAKVETPRSQLGGVAGGDREPSQTRAEGMTSAFKKWDRTES